MTPALEKRKMGHMTSHPTPKFKKLSDGSYLVSINGTIVGTVKKSNGVWLSFYNDGSQGYNGVIRIDAAWALINS